MALVKCKECGNEVARDAKTCPKCGTKLKMGFVKKLGLAVLGFFAFLIFVGVAGSKGSKGDSTSSSTANVTPEPQQNVESPRSPAATPEQAPSKPAGHVIGDKVEFADSTWIVLSAKDAGKTLKPNNQFHEAAQTDGRFVVVNFSVLNKTPKEERIATEPVLVDSQGREFSSLDSQTFYIPANKKTLLLEALPSSMTREFFAIYEVAADAKDLKFGARELSFSPDVKLVALNL